jgi:feruloyl esterase
MERRREQMRLSRLLAAIITLALMPMASAHAQTSCEGLSSLSRPDATITLARIVRSSAEFTLPTRGRPGTDQAFVDLRPFCRVSATLRPSPDSDIKIEVWMPTTNWNGKFQAVGNGGFAGSIEYAAMAEALKRGYATSSTDAGHVGESSDGSFALGHPEKVVDLGYRAVHEMTATAKALIAAFYGNEPRFSYWKGCSQGGRQGLREAQQYPQDYDGIIAGAPAANQPNHYSGSLWVASATLKETASFIPREKYSLINRAVLAACDASDGVADGVLEDPRLCDFDPKVLSCTSSGGDACLTSAQVDAARRIYAPARNPRTGEEIWPAMMRGSELGWAAQAGGPAPIRLATDFFKYLVFEDPDWDWRTFDFDRDVATATARVGSLVTTMNPDLRKFGARGGKLIMYHGWNDQAIAPENSVTYYTSVADTLGREEVDEFVRLFMVPGMEHCGGGPGPNTFDPVAALEAWVEQGTAPNRITVSRVTKGKVDRTRPLCSYPRVAVYKGVGTTDDASSFECRIPAPAPPR